MSDVIVQTFVLSMLPISELRGAIPYGVRFGLSLWQAGFFALLGNIFVIPILLAVTDPLFKYLKTFKHLRQFVENYEDRAARKMENYRKYRFWGLVLLVGIPIPTTGVYTGVVASRVLGMSYRAAFFANLIGVLMSGLIVTLLTAGVIHL